MSELENASSPIPPPPPEPARARLSPARWLAGVAAVAAVALFAIPFLIGDRGRASSPDEPSASSTPDSAATRGVCTAKQAPAKLAYTVKDMNGADVRLSDYKGKVILLNYWATWCGPCKIEIPDLVALQDKFKDEGFVILGVSQDDDPETLRAFASAYKMNYPVLVGRDQPDLLDAQGPLWGLPTSYLIGRDGTICTRHLGPATKEEFERELKALL
jgi:peroxiredoxin